MIQALKSFQLVSAIASPRLAVILLVETEAFVTAAPPKKTADIDDVDGEEFHMYTQKKSQQSVFLR